MVAMAIRVPEVHKLEDAVNVDDVVSDEHLRNPLGDQVTADRSGLGYDVPS